MSVNRTTPYRQATNANASQGLMALVVMLALLALVIVYCCWGSCCNLIRQRRRRRRSVADGARTASDICHQPSSEAFLNGVTSNHIHEHHHHHHTVLAGKSRNRARPVVQSPPPYEDLFGQELGNPPTYSSLQLDNSVPADGQSLPTAANEPMLNSVRTAAVMEPARIDDAPAVEPLLMTRTAAPAGRVLRTQSVPVSIGNCALTAIHIGNHET